MPIFKFIFTTSEAASALGCSTPTVYKYIHSGKLKAYRDFGHQRYQIFYDDLQRFLESLKRMKEPVPLPKHTNDFANSFIMGPTSR